MFLKVRSLTRRDQTLLSLCTQMYKRFYTNTLKHLHAWTYTQTLVRHAQTNTEMHRSMTKTWMSDRTWPSSHPQDKRGDNALYIFFSLQWLIMVQSEPVPENRSFLMRRSLLHNLFPIIHLECNSKMIFWVCCCLLVLSCTEATDVHSQWPSGFFCSFFVLFFADVSEHFFPQHFTSVNLE